MAFELPKLPYEKNALEPHISLETLEYHHGKHHQTYVNNLNNLLAEQNGPDRTLEEIILNSEGAVFNNAAQVWNHTFYWHCLSPNGGGLPQGELLAAINTKFGDFNEFHAQFTKTAVSTFGSGWAWLVKNQNGALEIISTSNADTPMRHKSKALLTCDVWEHAYY
ncbi:MAG: superoxide dismutase [Fe], partial [Gammaproteobacteria bacterium]|nr:superoxide dismutase [Fe] [Gammaproteobacteria bacterium]